MNAGHPPEAQIFEEALALPDPAKRAAYLDRACCNDSDLRARVEKLLAASNAAGTFLEPPPNRNPTIRLNADLMAISEKPGDKIGRYKLREQIGEGGCGVVYVAEQEEPVRRRVALKVIKLGMDTKQVVARFEAERQALALMDHPNIAKVLDAGATDTGRPYFVMELVRGIKITDYCDQNNLSTGERLKLFIQVCSAIQHAHQKGIIHRDIKPSNILVTLHDGVPVPKVIDFGIAKATSNQRLTDKTIYTAFEQFIGTPAYMSPEQAEMSGLDIDTRSDIYSLGVLLYELLTGRTPFDAATLLKAGLDQMRRIIREQEPQRPSTRLSTLEGADLTYVAQHRRAEAPKLLSLIRGDLDWIVMKALEKDRTSRYETANELALDIQRHLSSEPVIARPPTTLYQFQKVIRRNKLGFAAASAVLFALMIGLGISTWMFFKEREARERAVASENRALVEVERSEQVSQFMKDMLQAVGPSVARGRDTALLKEILDETALRVEVELATQPEVAADMSDTLGTVYRELGDYSKAETMHRNAIALRTHSHGDKNKEIAESLTLLGQVLHAERKLVAAESVYRQALDIQEACIGQENAVLATTLNHFGSLLRARGKLREAETMIRRSLDIRRNVLGLDHLDVAQSLKNLSLVARASGNETSGETLLREALNIQTKILGNDHLQVADAKYQLAKSLGVQGKFVEAELLFRESLSLQSRLLGNDHPSTIDTRSRLLTTLKSQGKDSEADAVQDQPLATRGNLPGPEQVVSVTTLSSKAHYFNRQGKRAEAEQLYRECILRLEATGGAESAEMADLMDALGNCLLAQGRHDEALTVLQAALMMRKRILGETNLETISSLKGVMEATRRQGDIKEYSRLVSDLERLVGERSADVATALNNLGGLFLQDGNLKEAERLYAKAIALRRGLFGNENQAVADSISYYANALRMQGKYLEAENSYREAIGIYRLVLAKGNLRTTNSFFNCINNIGSILCDQGKCSDAAVVLSEGAHLGDQRAQNALGLIYEIGKGVALPRFGGQVVNA